ncbi:metal-dependent hydrolase [Methanothermobacter sp. KEPCO-1]|uniref:metal-dependent hydrolase n=1 Tax=Methanothermobacter sp. KEPCO-1 TaxID=2603820 RepID=UPI0011CB23B0|nr:metal-dependent hydrolase [Methanothermobacter sp. KEPCO-1]QEF93791.1 metal-dependent hydrolase [Methanothermobacter sp. KEPCO-1]
MRFRTHITAAVALFLIVNLLHPVNSLINGALLAGAGSVLPDLLDFLAGRHRGIGHTLLILPPLLLLSLGSPGIGVPLLVGASSHLALDLFTVHGCPLLYPLNDTPYHCLRRNRRIKTGTAGEWAILSFLLVIVSVLSLVSVGALDRFNETDTERCAVNDTVISVSVDVDADRDVNVTRVTQNGSESVHVDFKDD